MVASLTTALYPYIKKREKVGGHCFLAHKNLAEKVRKSRHKNSRQKRVNNKNNTILRQKHIDLCFFSFLFHTQHTEKFPSPSWSDIGKSEINQTTKHPLGWFGHNLFKTLYERSFTYKFCSFRGLSQEFGGKSKKKWRSPGDSLFGCMFTSVKNQWKSIIEWSALHIMLRNCISWILLRITVLRWTKVFVATFSFMVDS